VTGGMKRRRALPGFNTPTADWIGAIPIQADTPKVPHTNRLTRSLPAGANPLQSCA
jgi:hypothetical protein